MEQQDEGFAARLAAIHARLDHPPGVMLGVRRLPILDPILDELEALPVVPTDAVAELERLAELFTRELLGTAPETVQRRVRIVELIRRANDGRLPPLAADPGDPFGEELRAMLESDEPLRRDLGILHPLVLRATSVAPSGKWLRDARGLVAATSQPARLAGAIGRVLAALVRADVVSRPDLLTGGVRPANQRLARGLLWFASVAFDSPGDTLARVGLRMGTSGRSDAVVRDTALANTCAALLGDASDPGAVAGLASMRQQITNRNVLKQVDRALTAQAARAGAPVDELVDASLSTLGLDEHGRLRIDVGTASATIRVDATGTVSVRWRLADGREVDAPPEGMADAEPGLVGEVAAAAGRIDAAMAEELRRLEQRLASTRSWALETWRARFLDHPVAGRLGGRLVWDLDGARGATSVFPVFDGLIGVDDRPVDPPAGSRIRLWHPAEARAGEAAAWQATLAARSIQQPFRQVDRETFHPAADPRAPNADLRFAGRLVEHRRLRALLRERGWAVPSLGAWDQGDEATAWRAFEDGLRAELRYQSPERVPTGEPVERARIVAVRFVRTDAAPASPAADPVSVPLAEVAGRVFSEAMRDVSLVIAVGSLSPDG